MNRLKSIAVWVLQFLLAALFAIQGIVKLNGSPAWIARFRGWGYPDHFYFAVGLAELLGSILLLIPRLAKFRALLLIVVMAGATTAPFLHPGPHGSTTLPPPPPLPPLLYLPRRPPRNA